MKKEIKYYYFMFEVGGDVIRKHFISYFKGCAKGLFIKGIKQGEHTVYNFENDKIIMTINYKNDSVKGLLTKFEESSINTFLYF